MTKQFSQQLADDPGHAIAVFIQGAHMLQTTQARGALKSMHALAHHPDTSLDGAPLRLLEPHIYADNAFHVLHEFPLSLIRALGELRQKVPDQACRLVLSAYHL